MLTHRGWQSTFDNRTERQTAAWHSALTKQARFASVDRAERRLCFGDHATLDFGVFHRDYCDILRQIWREVPVIWSAGLAVEESPPNAHRRLM